jgi:integrase
MTLDQARNVAVVRRAGLSPVVPTNVAAGPSVPVYPTLGQAFEEYLQMKSHRLKSSTLKDYRINFDRYLKEWQDCPLNQVTSARLLSFYQSLAERSLAKANYALRIISFIYNMQIVMNDYPHKNPVLPIIAQKLIKPLQACQRLIPAGNLAAWWPALEQLDRAPRDYIKLALLLGFRRSTLLTLRWDLLELDTRQYPFTEDTAGNKSKERIGYPLGPYATDLLLQRKSEISEDSVWVFPGQGGRRGGHAAGFEGSFNTLHELTGIRISPHDLRRTRATIAGTLGLNTITLKRLLTHKLAAAPVDAQVTGDYTISTTESLRPHVEAVERLILQTAGATLPLYRLKTIMGAEPGRHLSMKFGSISVNS